MSIQQRRGCATVSAMIVASYFHPGNTFDLYSFCHVHTLLCKTGFAYLPLKSVIYFSCQRAAGLHCFSPRGNLNTEFADDKQTQTCAVSHAVQKKEKLVVSQVLPRSCASCLSKYTWCWETGGGAWRPLWFILHWEMWRALAALAALARRPWKGWKHWCSVQGLGNVVSRKLSAQWMKGFKLTTAQYSE